MHQSYNIPWHLIEANFKFMTKNKGIYNFQPGYYPKDNPHHDIARDLKHFIKKFVSTILPSAHSQKRSALNPPHASSR